MFCLHHVSKLSLTSTVTEASHHEFTVTFAIQRSKAGVKHVCTLFELQHSLKLSRLACPNGVKWVMIHDLFGELGFMTRRAVPDSPTLWIYYLHRPRAKRRGRREVRQLG